MIRTSGFVANDVWTRLTYEGVRKTAEATGSINIATGTFMAPKAGFYAFTYQGMNVRTQNVKKRYIHIEVLRH